METLLDEQTVALIRDYVPRNATLHMLSEFFGACADATRAKIICALAISEMCVGDLARVLGLNQTTCSHQLRLLRAADIVHRLRPPGRQDRLLLSEKPSHRGRHVRRRALFGTLTQPPAMNTLSGDARSECSAYS